MRKTYLVCYDIADDYRRGQVARTMRGFGDRIQYSIFECQLRDVDLVRCRLGLSKLIDHRQDQVLFVDLGPSEGRGDRVITAVGKTYSHFDAPCIIAG